MTGKRVFWYFAAFFGFIAVVNAVMMTLAIRTHSGVVTDHAYEKGLAYNKVVEAKEAQEKLGWKGEIELLTSVGEGILHFIIKDRSGHHIIPDKAIATITRPTQSGMDFTIELKNAETRIDFPAKGVWDVRVDAVIGEKPFQQTKRIVVE